MGANPFIYGTLLVAALPLATGANYYETHYAAPARENNRNALKLANYKWPNGIVPYLWAGNFDASEQDAILGAINFLQQQTCVFFIPKTDDQLEHIQFNKSAYGCGSVIGYRRGQAAPLEVSLDDFCLGLPGAIQHELLHVLGLFHEHTRPDRDDYVEVLWDNVVPEFRMNFARGSWDYMETFGLPYDYDSVMHYPTYAYAKPGTTVTMVSKRNPSEPLGQTDGASFYDLEKIRRMYNCV